MVKIEEIQEQLENSVITVGTVTKENRPHLIIVMYAKILNDKILITDNYMQTTIENIKNNKNISLAFWEGEEGWRIEGEAEYFDSGKYLDYVKKLEENEGLPAKGAVVVTIKNIAKLG